MLEPLADRVDPRRLRHAAVLADATVAGLDRQPQPRVVRTVTGREQDRADPLGTQVEARRRGCQVHRLGPDPRPHLVGQARALDEVVDPVEEAVHGRVRARPGSSAARHRTRAVRPCSACSRPASRHPARLQHGRGRGRAPTGRGRCDRRAASTVRVVQPPGRASRRWSGRAVRWPPATSRCRDRGSGAASGCAGRPTRTTSRPARLSSSAICTPEAEAPTTRTPPSGSWPGLRYSLEVSTSARRRPAGTCGRAVRAGRDARCCRRARCPGPSRRRSERRRDPRPGPAPPSCRRPRARRTRRRSPEVVDELAGREVPVGVGSVVAPAGQPRHPARGQQVQRVPASRVRQRSPTRPRSRTTWSWPASVSSLLTARPAWPAPMTTVSTVVRWTWSCPAFAGWVSQ